ncbi:hypothetical protein Z945_1354 [Sulfitobacter noctilucae]|nr:hypothetical protein Z945_1354 [Sulfitobacter noctilucae]
MGEVDTPRCDQVTGKGQTIEQLTIQVFVTHLVVSGSNSTSVRFHCR